MPDSRPITGPTFDGETVLVTGASRGIGHAIAASFAARGARVAMIARSGEELAIAAREIERGGGRAHPWVADVTDPAAMQAVIADVERTLGPIAVLVNNAGAVEPLGPLSDADHDAWWRTVEVNLRGPAIGMRLVLPLMQARQRGRIINVVSGAGVMSYAYFSAYVASKTALVRLSECVAAEAKPYGVAVFAMDPGTVATAMSGYAVSSEVGRRWIPWFRELFDRGFNVPPERAGARAVELASGRADAITGRFIPMAAELDTLIANADLIALENHYSLRIRPLGSPPTGPAAEAVAALRARAERASASIVLLRSTYPVSRERAFAAWTSADAIARWFLPETGARWLRPPAVDPTPGGAFSLEMESDGVPYRLFGRYRQIEGARRLVLEWSWDTSSPVLGAASGTVVTVEFLDHPGGTEVVVSHEGFASEAVRDAYVSGWARCLAGLRRLFAGESAQGAGDTARR